MLARPELAHDPVAPSVERFTGRIPSPDGQN
jgi:hypothetical protein